MLRYEILGNTTIKVDLHNRFSVVAIANWNHDTEKYTASFYLQRNDVNVLDLMEDLENTEFAESDMKSIKIDLTKFIDEKLSEGSFDYYMKRYSYMLSCFDKGSEILKDGE